MSIVNVWHTPPSIPPPKKVPPPRTPTLPPPPKKTLRLSVIHEFTPTTNFQYHYVNNKLQVWIFQVYNQKHEKLTDANTDLTSLSLHVPLTPCCTLHVLRGRRHKRRASWRGFYCCHPVCCRLVSVSCHCHGPGTWICTESHKNSSVLYVGRTMFCLAYPGNTQR